MVECFTRDRGVAGSTSREALCCVIKQDTNLCIVLVQTRKTRPNMTETFWTEMNKATRFIVFSHIDHKGLG